ncbi:PadR family transcriptional regulator [Sinanaerobacter chloroacetimidivorans]|uniref:PadR family transcriptional regulator n=1 Tax=Sinanaerobacter chloroacetimidivorans TaxID=2818044 RepID=A0A8J7W3V7_9FIRM|nr:PadR family transcriptional regulator [Sinanaerobacter chloroacetimidivorans]MBR0600389.1 PadR family transcriptional regulator [Sinanaerobacter chloroacetimidivorans]
MSLQNAVLGILTYSPMTGYQLGKIFDKSVNYSWTASLSQIYRELGILEKKGFVTSEIEKQDDRPDKRIYYITDEGKEAFVQWLEDFPENFASPKRDEFALRIFFGSQLDDAEMIRQFQKFVKEREEFGKIMDRQKTAVMELNRSIKKTTEKTSDQKDELYWNFIIKRAMMTNEVLIQWAKECIGELLKRRIRGGSK